MRGTVAFASIIAGSAILLGCSHDTQQASGPVAAPASYGFHFLDEGASAKLAFGQANSDNVGLMLQCAKGEGMVEVSDLVRSAPAPTLTLKSAGGRSDVRVEIVPGPGAEMAVGTTPMATSALAGFRKSGVMEVSYAGLTYAMTAKSREKPALERFFSACETSI